MSAQELGTSLSLVLNSVSLGIGVWCMVVAAKIVWQAMEPPTYRLATGLLLGLLVFWAGAFNIALVIMRYTAEVAS